MSNKIGLIGPGRLGLSVALLLEEAGYNVIAVENNRQYLEKLSSKALDSPEPGVNERMKRSEIRFTSDIQTLVDENIKTILIYVPTPDSDEGYDHSVLESVLNFFIDKGPVATPVTLMIGCTTLPGFCKPYEERLAMLNYQVVYSPSFIAQGSIIKNLHYPDMLLFGSQNEKAITQCEEVMKSITQIEPIVSKMDTLSAEITKLATNCFLTAKIAFANAIGDLAIKTGGNQEAILKAIGSDSRVGSLYLKYGFGYGGPCFPRDNRALNYFAKQNDYELLLSEATEKANHQHTAFQAEQFLKDYKESESIHFDHVTYKPGTDIIEESQQLKIAVEIARKGRKVTVEGNSRVIRQLKNIYGDLFIYVLKNE